MLDGKGSDRGGEVDLKIQIQELNSNMTTRSAEILTIKGEVFKRSMVDEVFNMRLGFEGCRDNWSSRRQHSCQGPRTSDHGKTAESLLA